MTRKAFLPFIFAILFAIFFTHPVFAKTYKIERILSFHSDIKVHQDGSMTVAETIQVNSTGREIKRGIYRDFPTRYRDRYGNDYVVDFDVIKVLRDDEPESYHLKDLANGKRIYIGRTDFFLSPGEYTYTVVYKTNRQLGFFKDFDELYWNVTGNGWSFQIDKASAMVELPQGASEKIMGLDGYTGKQGSKEKDFSIFTDDVGNVTFVTKRPLMPREGLTILVAWPKGYIAEPAIHTRLGYFIHDNLGTATGLAGLLILLVYYLIVWTRFGKDPAKGTVIPLYNPPDRFSPASIRYIMKMGFDNKVLTAAIIDMAVRGYITINEEDGTYTLKKIGGRETVLTPEESAIANRLFGSHDGEIELKTENHVKIHSAIDGLKRSLGNSLDKIYFFTNRQYFIPGLVISCLIMITSSILESQGKLPLTIFMSIWLTGWSFGVIFLLRAVISLWKGFIFGGSHKASLLGRALFMSLFATPFVSGELFGISALVSSTSLSVIAILALMVFINLLFYRLLKAPTLTGRKIMDKIEGFKMYLSVAEKDRLNILNPPEKTPELFEKYLPYALALDVEQEWAEQFSDVLWQAARTGIPYRPGWYSGSTWDNLGAAGFTSSLSNSFSSAISSSSSAPGSSSGGGGGGSSGGGGGGGGGGGW